MESQSLEIAASLAFATNRTLAFPPPFNMYLRGKSGLEDYFELDDLKKGLPVIMHDEFKQVIGWQRPGALLRPGTKECPVMGKAQSTVRVKYDMTGFSWISAGEFCRSKGADLCCAANICEQQGGPPFFEVP
eukprot:7295765-Pyramimonas_sp.AAC.1